MLPAHIAHTLRETGSGKLTRKWFEQVEDGYESLMMKVMPHRYIFTVLALAGMVAAAMIAGRFLVFVSTPETNVFDVNGASNSPQFGCCKT